MCGQRLRPGDAGGAAALLFEMEFLGGGPLAKFGRTLASWKKLGRQLQLSLQSPHSTTSPHHPPPCLRTSISSAGRSSTFDRSRDCTRGTPPPTFPNILTPPTRHGKRLDHDERKRKKLAREGHDGSKKAQNYRGLRAKLYAEKRRKEKIQMKKTIRAHEERNVKTSEPAEPSTEALPQYLLDRSNEKNAKALSSAIKQKRNEKAARFSVPLPKVKGISEEEMFSVVKTGKKTAKKSWKRMITKPTFVGPGFTRRPVKYERFIRPMGLRYKKANVTHPELSVTVQLPIISVKKNPQNPLYTQLGVLTKGTIIEVNVSELGLVTAGGKVVWGRYARKSYSNNSVQMIGANRFHRGHKQPRERRLSERRSACLDHV